MMFDYAKQTDTELIHQLRTENTRLADELENAKLGENFHDQQANDYAQQVAYWIERYDVLHANFVHETKELAAVKAELEALRSASSEPVGWKLVPLDPTIEMLEAIGDSGRSIWLDALDAAPAYPHPAQSDKDAERLDYLQECGATVHIRLNGLTPLFEIGGVRSTLNADIRAAIDRAMQGEEK